ncbi:unnamed protein product [Gulo gulo]|uniref:Uncharacterized protein n=1 Tax=Gulo gulo TaxID=48420 RepID=A0A9X9Q7X5_GULGU|nr:unnamed protein product [Gulo gulo]
MGKRERHEVTYLSSPKLFFQLSEHPSPPLIWSPGQIP